MEIQYIRNDFNVGPCKNLIKVVAAAVGEFVWILGDDDPLNKEIGSHLYEIIKNNNIEIDYIFMPRILVTSDLKPSKIGIQPSEIRGDMYFLNGRELYNACEGQIPELIGFYGSNIIRKKVWDKSLNEIDFNCDSWFHMKIILNAIKDRPCAISGLFGVHARLFTARETLDSNIWIDNAIPVYIQAIKWGYCQDLCERVIKKIFKYHALLFVLDKAEGKRSGNILSIAKNFDLKRINEWNSIWILISYLPRHALIPLLWIRKVRKIMRYCAGGARP